MSTLKKARDDVIRQLFAGKDIYLYGRNAKGVFEYIKKDFPLPLLDMSSPNFSRGGSSDYLVFALRAENIGVLEDRRMMVPVSENARLILIDEEGSNSSKPEIKGRNFYVIEAKSFLQREGTYDVDIVIKYAMASLYLDVFDVFVTHGEGEQQPYFQTSGIIEYSRSRPILEGLLLSAFKKFPNIDVIASREIIGESYQHKVRMYELAESIAQALGIESVKIEETTDEDSKDEKKYVISSNIEKRNVLVLDDVVMSGKTIASLKRSVNRAHGEYKGAVVLMDRSEEHLQDVYALTDMKTFMELKERRDQQNGG